MREFADSMLASSVPSPPRPPELLLALDEAHRLGGEKRSERHTDPLQPGAKIWRLQELAQVRGQLPDNRVGCALGCNQHLPAHGGQARNGLCRADMDQEILTALAFSLSNRHTAGESLFERDQDCARGPLPWCKGLFCTEAVASPQFRADDRKRINRSTRPW
jgi:hypothetical protein